MRIDINAFLKTLPMMLEGMGIIFSVIIAIYLVVVVLRKVFK